MHLLGTRDHLYLCHVLWGEVIYVWVLEDYSKWAWYKRYKVNLEWDVKRFPFDNNPGNSPSYDPRYLKLIKELLGMSMRVEMASLEQLQSELVSSIMSLGTSHKGKG
ncbi:hypothetical protein LguiB_006384 [Lonicera macranthoides]